MRNRLLTIRQTGGYSGYVGKFRELYRILRVDQLTAMNLFVNGLSDMQMKREIQRRQPRDLNDAIQIGFLEWEIREKPPGNNRPTETSFCGRGPHRAEDCWFKHPEKRPSQANKKVNTMFARMTVAEDHADEGNE
ncbi:hypothetical protein PHYSODRAFT_493870 [Phytophthora sojae]|uniref:Retrotransposon gag domain-containing protein n=1 Tax=Phytophthora sojae (strain P6497) TaxID=1094619 RepID=G4Z448_PHYSP|nr:hypothetical protein PHYSODRAFT_493870 [Phytophthora sojae]EGZ22242.1 hypothetical protein PHYSODRAFT_493870 [Phytophthora sojae]|eukprot:XP_009524959.1 hypothetical protein PHYSODRAFT_493870 [Phytophthora sojae]